MNLPANPRISVLIPTFNRAPLLRQSLESLAAQTLPKSEYEVVVIDDGSTDATGELCRQLSDQLPLRYFRIRNSGISAAKNLALFASTAPVVLFLDDDDIADPELLRQHLATHEKHPSENIAVLGYTTWAPSLKVTEVMHYVTDVGCFLFSYNNLTDGQELDFTYFWGGRSSCKRSLLAQHGVFRQEFRFGSEDIELGYRLSKFGLKVMYNRQAIQYMNRAITFEEFCKRCEKQGVSQYDFGQMHADSFIQNYCQTIAAKEKWNTVRDGLPGQVKRVHEIESLLTGVSIDGFGRLKDELHSHYRETFNSFKWKGIVSAMQRTKGGETDQSFDRASAAYSETLSKLTTLRG